jgi:predicted membrane protein
MHARWSQKKKKDFDSPNQAVNEEDFLNSTTIFGGIKKRYFSKNFKGGKLTCMMGGVEVDLGNCDIQEPVIIEITQVFGGTKLIVPSNWQIRSELVAIAGGVEDKRYQPVAGIEDDTKLLILKGTTIFGGIDIKSY